MARNYPKTHYHICQNLTEISNVIEYVKAKGVCSFDFETNAEEFWKEGAYPTIIGISFQPGSAYIIPLGHFDSIFKDRFETILQMLNREIFSNTDILKVAWNVKFEWRWLKRYGCDLQGRVFDAMLAKYLLDENSRNGLKENVAAIMPEYAGYDNEIDELKEKHKGWGNIPLIPLSKYCGMDCDLTLRLMMLYHPKLIKNKLYQLFRNMLMMATRTLTESEFHGIPVDVPYLNLMIEKYDGLIEDKKAEIFKIKSVRKFLRKRKTEHIDKLISDVKLEIKQIIKEDKPTKDRLIKARQDKITRYLNGELTTKKEKTNQGLNLAAPQQIAQLLYISKNGYRLPIIKFTKNNKTKKISKNPATDEETLQQYLDGVACKCDANNRRVGNAKIEITNAQRRFLEKLLELRGLEKMQSTNLRGMLKHIDPNGNVIHPSYHLLTVTGRLGCREPNMQNIPRVTTNPDVKPMFVPWIGTVLGEVDYGSAELRTVAEYAEDEAMIDIFKRNYNPHVATAAINNGGIQMYDIAKATIKKADNISAHELRLPENKEILKWVKEKKRAKTVNFGILFGEGEEKLGKELGMAPNEARKYIQGWFDGYPGIAEWIKNQHRKVAEDGFVMSLWGRKRRLEEIWSDDKWKRLEAQRQSVNAPPQSAASDFTLFSTINIREQRLKGKLPSYLIQLYTVHDSIGYPFKPKDIDRVMPIIVKVCDNPGTKEWFDFEMKHVKMKVSPEIGQNWGSLRDYKPGEDYRSWVRKN